MQSRFSRGKRRCNQAIQPIDSKGQCSGRNDSRRRRPREQRKSTESAGDEAVWSCFRYCNDCGSGRRDRGLRQMHSNVRHRAQ